MPLPISKRFSQTDDYRPTKKDFQACFEIATTPDGADYMLQQYEKRLATFPERNNSEEPVVAMKDVIARFASNVHLQRDNRPNAWNGDPVVKTDFQNFQTNLANNAANSLSKSAKESIQMSFAVSNEANVLRRFSVNAQKADTATTNHMDVLFNACLAENQLSSCDGAIYKINDNGEILKNQNNEDQRASAEDVQKVILEKLPLFLKEKDIDIKIKQQKFPQETAPTVAKTQEPVSQIDTAPTETITPAHDEAPSLGSTTPGS